MWKEWLEKTLRSDPVAAAPAEESRLPDMAPLIAMKDWPALADAEDCREPADAAL